MKICWLSSILLSILSFGCGHKESSSADTARLNREDSASDTMQIKNTVKTDSLTLAFVGDIMMGTTFPDSVSGTHLPKDDGKHLFDDCRDIFENADIVAGNLEGSFLTGPGERRPMTNPKTYFIFRMPPEYVSNLKEAGFDFMGIANNHINDFGESGRRSTMSTLREGGLQFAGLKGICETAIIERNGFKVAFTQFGHGSNNLDVTDMDELRRVVKNMRDSADIVIVSFHGGAEGSDHAHVPFEQETFLGERRGNVAEFAHSAIDAGADVVFGHGPHVPRGVEIYNGHIIFYSLGNFCTPYRMGIAGATGYAPVAEITIGTDGKFISGKIHSFIQQRGRGPVCDPTNSVSKFMRQLTESDFPSTGAVIAEDGSLSAK